VIPGIVVLALYGKNLFNHADHLLKGSEASRAFCIFLTAWLIGLTLDLGVFAIGSIALTNAQKICPILSPFCEKLLPKDQPGESDTKKPDTYARQNENDSQKSERMLHERFLGEKILFRVMLSISVITIFWPPITFLPTWRLFYSFVATAVFLGCWLWRVYS
jgi:hypothetical protein